MAKLKVRSIDGITYKSYSLVKIHQELKDNKYVKTFRLPQQKDKNTKSKYGAYKVEINDIVFDSIMEGRYYAYLLTEKANKNIKSFERQVKFNLLPKGKNKFKNKTIRETNYIADFVIVKKDNSKLVVDVKGKKTPEFKIKEKIFMLKYPDLEFVCIQWHEKTKSWKDLEEI